MNITSLCDSQTAGRAANQGPETGYQPFEHNDHTLQLALKKQQKKSKQNMDMQLRAHQRHKSVKATCRRRRSELSAAHSTTQNVFMLFEKMEMPSALFTIWNRGGKTNVAVGRREVSGVGATVKWPVASPEVTWGHHVRVESTFCLGWLGDDTTTVLQMVRAMKKSMMSARSDGSCETGWLWKRMKSIWLLPSFTLSRSWGSGVMSFSCGEGRRRNQQQCIMLEVGVGGWCKVQGRVGLKSGYRVHMVTYFEPKSL